MPIWLLKNHNSNYNSKNLEAKLNEVNAEKKLTRWVPNQEQLQEFIDLAKELDPKVTH